jgi:hypothetical protein
MRTNGVGGRSLLTLGDIAPQPGVCRCILTSRDVPFGIGSAQARARALRPMRETEEERETRGRQGDKRELSDITGQASENYARTWPRKANNSIPVRQIRETIRAESGQCRAKRRERQEGSFRTLRDKLQRTTLALRPVKPTTASQ